MAETNQFEWLTGVEAVLRRPDAYVGANDPVEEEVQTIQSGGTVETLKFTMSPILMKIIDEVIVNAIDGAARDPLVRNISCAFDRSSGFVCVENDGSGIPIKEFGSTGRLIPSVIFSELHAGSNFADSEARLTGGRNGVGVSCTNVWSTSFEVEVRDGKQRFRQRFESNLTTVHEPEVEAASDRKGLVRVRFRPDYERMGMNYIENGEIIEKLLHMRCLEAGVCLRSGAIISFQNVRLSNKPQDFLRILAGTDTVGAEDFGSSVGAGCSLVFGRRLQGLDFYGFVNGVRCDGGTLSAHVRDRLTKIIVELIHKRQPHLTVRSQTVRDVLAILCVARVVNPRFTSQSKDSLATRWQELGFQVENSNRLSTKLQRMGIVDEILQRESERELIRGRQDAKSPTKLSK